MWEGGEANNRGSEDGAVGSIQKCQLLVDSPMFDLIIYKSMPCSQRHVMQESGQN